MISCVKPQVITALAVRAPLCWPRSAVKDRFSGVGPIAWSVYFAGAAVVLRRLATSQKKLIWVETVFSPWRSAVATILSGGWRKI